MLRADSPRYQRFLLCAYSFAYVACGCACNMVGPTLGDLARRTGVKPSALGVVFLASIGGTLATVPTGKLMDHAPGHAVLAAAYVLMGFFFACIPAFSHTVPELVAYRGLADVFVAGAVTATNMVMSDAFGSRTRRYQVGMNAICGFWGVGSVLSPVVARMAHNAFGARLDGFYVAAGALALAGLLVGLAQSPARGGPDAARSAQQRSGTKRDEDDPAGDGQLAGAGDALQQRLLSAVADDDTEQGANNNSGGVWPAVAATAAFLYLSVGAEVAVGGWLHTFARERGGTTLQADLLNTLYWASFTVTRLGAAVASMRYASLGPRTILLATLPLLVAGAALMFCLKPESPVGLLWLSAVLAGAGVSTGYANGVALLTERAQLSGLQNGVINIGAALGAATVPPVVSLCVTHTRMRYRSLPLLVIVLGGLDMFLVGVIARARPVERQEARND